MPWADPQAVERSRTQPAGVIAAGFLPAFVPIAVNEQGGVLFVDTRPGRWSGCVTESSDDCGRRWDSVTEMLAEIADVLEGGGVSSYYRPSTASGWLEWQIVPGTTREPREGSWIKEPELSGEEAVRRMRESDDFPVAEVRWDEGEPTTEVEAITEAAEYVTAEPKGEPIAGFEAKAPLLDAVLAEMDRYPVPERVRDLPLGRLGALMWVSQGAPSGLLASILFRWGVEEEPLVQLDGAMDYLLVGDQSQYTAVDRGAAAALEGLRMPLAGRQPEGERLLDLSPGELVRWYADWVVAYYRDNQTKLNFFEWSRSH